MTDKKGRTYKFPEWGPMRRITARWPERLREELVKKLGKEEATDSELIETFLIKPQIEQLSGASN